MTQYAHLVQIACSKLAAALLALATHYVLHNGEWDNSFHVFLCIWTFAFSSLGLSEIVYDPRARSVFSAMSVTAASAAVYFAVLTTSILLHRAFFHRLQNVRIDFHYIHYEFALLIILIDSWSLLGAPY